MKKISSSPQRYSFQKQKYLERRQSEGRTPENDPDTAVMADFFDRSLRDHIAKEEDPDWQRNNMEYDLRTTDWIIEKVRSSENYAQNLYAAMCNNEFQKTYIADEPDSVVSILKDGPPTWGCSWRYAGGIIADMRGEGDYIDWYCSGIRNSSDDEEENKIWDERKYVAESVVTDEIRDDLKKLGWRVINEDEEDPLL